MKSIIRKRPSPSMIVAMIALFIALSGGAYASVALNQVRSVHIKNGEVKNADLATNAVGTAKIRNNAVISSKVKDGSLEAADLSAAAAAALRGAAGPAGPAGATGPAGAAGATGPAGPSDAFSTFHDGAINIPLAETTLVTLNVPAGKYVAWGKGIFNVNTTFPVPSCKLVAGADTDTSLAFFNGPTQYQVPFALNVVHEFAAAGAIQLRCLLGNGSAQITASNIKITAIKVGTLSNVAG